DSRNATVQSNDLGFVVGEDGAPFTLAGAGLSADDPSGLAARVSASGGIWHAELRIDAAKLGGWGHVVGLDAGHFSLGGADYQGPSPAEPTKPATWARPQLALYRLGLAGVLRDIDPARQLPPTATPAATATRPARPTAAATATPR